MSNVANWNDYEDNQFLLYDVLGLKDPSPVSNPPPVIQDDPPMTIGSGVVKVGLEGEKHIFRHAKEVQKGSRGGYLKGKKDCFDQIFALQTRQVKPVLCVALSFVVCKKLFLYFQIYVTTVPV